MAEHSAHGHPHGAVHGHAHGKIKSVRGKVSRLLDANVNRAREGIRVVEETCRFVLERPVWARSLRSIRHRLDLVSRKAYPALLSARSVETDEGRKFAGGAHRTLSSLMSANFRRSEEALRVLEEYARFLSPKSGFILTSLRFELYRWEQRILSQLQRRRERLEMET